jgi:hypothetical protein
MWFRPNGKRISPMKKTSKATGAKDKIDYFAIVSNTPAHLQPPSENASMLRKRIDEYKRSIGQGKK